MPDRALAAFAGASAIAGLAWRAGSLSRSGAIAAAAIGTAAVTAGWAWGALLILFFTLSVLLSRLGEETKAARTSAVVAKGGARDAWQVAANGGVFALLALTAGSGGPHRATAAAAAAGALAAAAADTWATEVGTLAGGTPRSLLTLRQVAPGTSGGVSVAGTLALVGGATTIATAATMLGVTSAVLAVAAAGIAGALADSLLGATLQARRWCAACSLATEREVHACGGLTAPHGGVAWLDNDAVNLAATVAGALVAAALTQVA